MSLHGSVKSLIRICQFCGLAPIFRNENISKWEPNSHLKAISIALITLSVLLFLCVIICPNFFLNPIDSKIDKVLFFLLLIANHILAMFALLELFIKYDKQVKLWNIFEKLDNLLKYHLNQHLNYTNLKNKCNRLIMACFCECLFLELFNILSKIQTENATKLSYTLVFCPFYVLNRLSFAYSNMLIIIIHEQFDVLNKYLKLINKQNGYYICDQYLMQNDLKHSKWSKLIKNKSNLNIETIHSMKNIYCQIWKATDIMTNLTRWTLAIGLANEFFVLNFNLYSIIACIFFEFLPISKFLMLLVFVGTNLCNLLFVGHYSNKILEDVSKQNNQNNNDVSFNFYRNFLCLGVFFPDEFELYFEIAHQNNSLLNNFKLIIPFIFEKFDVKCVDQFSIFSNLGTICVTASTTTNFNIDFWIS